MRGLPAAAVAPEPAVAIATPLRGTAATSGGLTSASVRESAAGVRSGELSRFSRLRSAQHVGRRLIAQAAVLLERLGDDPLELGGQMRVERARRHRRLVQNPVEDDGRRRAGERLPAGRHLVEHDAERKQIGARVELLAARLFRRHVGDGARSSCRGSVEVARRHRRPCDIARRRLRLRRQLGEAEVEHLRLAARGDEDVGRLDVAVDDAVARARRRARRRSAIAEIEQLVERQRPAADAGASSVLAVEQLHDDERLALVLADVVDRADVRMVQRRGGARLALEALERLRVARQLARQELERDLAAEARVLGAVDDTHAAAAEPVEDAVVGEDLIDQRLRIILGRTERPVR